MNQDFSIVQLVLHASFVVQVVMAGLMLASLASCEPGATSADRRSTR